MPPERSSRPRQEPVSCESCRKKKLKCNRLVPCSNCQARGLSCSFHGRLPAAPPTSIADEQDLRAENAAIKARLLRLENEVFGASTQRIFRSPCSSTTDPMSTGITTPSMTQAVSPDTEHEKAYAADSRWLEGAASLSSLTLPFLAGRPIVRIEPLQNIIRATVSSVTPTQVLLPLRPEALQLLDCYIEHIDSLWHIFYTPNIRTIFHKTFDALEHGKEFKYSHITLILSFLASIAAHLDSGTPKPTVFPTSTESLNVSVYWLRGALDIQQYTLRTVTSDLELVQATILLGFLLYRMGGFSPQIRALFATAISSARDIGLHLTDSIQNKLPEETQEQIIDKEIRRRVWWHLASTEWCLSLSGGPHEGVYSVSPRHILVKKPRNINDEDLATQPANFTRPMSESTSASYYIQRIRLAEICREVADITWELSEDQGSGSMSYERVVMLDARFDTLLQEMPESLRVDETSKDATNPAYAVDPQLAKQKYFNLLNILARRAKLHLPFLLRYGRDPRFAFSRDICLQCARAALKLKHILPSGKPYVDGEIKISGVLHHFFCAIVVLVMDFCVNRHDGCEAARKAEIQQACEIFKDARAHSTASATYLDSLEAILRKHSVWLQRNTSTDLTHASEGFAGLLYWPGAAESAGEHPQVNGEKCADSGLDDIDLSKMWQSYIDLGSSINPEDWDAVFSDMDLQM